MKRILTFFAIVVLSLGLATAQIGTRTITGVVIDTNGNPLPGAEVIATGGGASAMTDADGSFSLNISPYLKTFTVYYVGLGSKVQKINGGSFFVVTMEEKQSDVFTNLVVGGITCTNNNVFSTTFGLMVGKFAKWGFYGKAYYGTQGTYSVTAGLVKSFYKRNAFLYLGAGLASVKTMYDVCIEDAPGLGVDLGVMIKIKHFDFSVGLIYAYEFDYESMAFGPQISIGYVF